METLDNYFDLSGGDIEAKFTNNSTGKEGTFLIGGQEGNDTRPGNGNNGNGNGSQGNGNNQEQDKGLNNFTASGVKVNGNDKDPDNNTPENKDPENKDPENKDPENKDPENKDPENKDPENKDPENKDPENKDPENKDPENKDPENKDPENKDPEDNKDPIIPTPDPVIPTPDPIVPAPTPAPLPRIFSYFYEEPAVTPPARTIILDEEVPLADAPLTGDLSGIWAVISGLSLGGMALLNRKRKDEDA